MLYRKICQKCGKEFVSASRFEIADQELCDQCHTYLPTDFEEFDPEAQHEVEAVPGFEEEEAEELPDELELRYEGTSIVVQLPRMSGVVGRVPINCDAIKTFSTISRKQFTYNYLSAGGLEIVNNSQFGTVVNKVFLDVGESMIVVPPAMVEMGGCYSFELRAKEE